MLIALTPCLAPPAGYELPRWLSLGLYGLIDSKRLHILGEARQVRMTQIADVTQLLGLHRWAHDLIGMEALAGPPARRVNLLGQFPKFVTVFFRIASAVLTGRSLVCFFVHFNELGKLLLIDLAPE